MTETEKKAVGRYLDWHTGILLETDEKMGVYRKEGGKLIYKEKADSEDGYLGMYLFLMGKYLEKTESTDLPEHWKKGNQPCVKKDPKPDAGWICTECEKLYGLYERKIKRAFIPCI